MTVAGCGRCDLGGSKDHGGLFPLSTGSGRVFTNASNAGQTRDMTEDADMEWVMIDATILRAHQHAASAKKGIKIKR